MIPTVVLPSLIYRILFLIVLIPVQSWAVEVHGHRGARAVRPENTLPAFQYALEVGVDVLELDLHVTKDRELVLSHNAKIPKDLCLGPGGKPISKEPPIYSLTLSEVKEYDCGSLRHSKYPNQVSVPNTPIPTLAELFKLVNESNLPSARKVRFNIETKMNPARLSPPPEEFVSLVMREIEAFGMIDRVIIQSFDFRTLREVRKTHPQVVISALVEDSRINLIKVAEQLKPEIISPEWQMLDEDLVARLHSRGVQVAPWTANNAPVWRKLLEWKVDAVITDDPKGLIDYLNSYR
jgi:glycerophosphoryl diester phosphodiesterase